MFSRNRFQKKSSEHTAISKERTNKSTVLSVLIFLILLFLFYRGFVSVSSLQIEEQQTSLENALQQNIVHCYAVEGVYPPSLSYLEENYGITYDHSLFFVDYRPLGANLLPQVTVVPIMQERSSHEPAN